MSKRAFDHRPAALRAHLCILLLSVVALCAPPAMAEPAPAGAGAAAMVIPAGTIVDFEITDHVNSKLNHIGDTFGIRLIDAVRVGGKTVIPAGAIGRGEVIHSARARAGGKAGELILAARYVDAGATRVALRSFRFGRSGINNTGTGLAVAFIGGPLGYLVVGGEVDIAAGTPGNAKTASDVTIGPETFENSTGGER